jgi:hypothetical protein
MCKTLGQLKTSETEQFCRVFNKFFVCLNTRNPNEAKHKQNSDLEAYEDKEDDR